MDDFTLSLLSSTPTFNVMYCNDVHSRHAVVHGDGAEYIVEGRLHLNHDTQRIYIHAYSKINMMD